MRQSKMDFSETSMCADLTHCVACRNDENFRVRMQKFFGDWECPRGFPIGVDISDLPQSAQEFHDGLHNMQQNRRQRQTELITILNQLEIIIPIDYHDLVVRLRSLVAPMSRSPCACQHGHAYVGQIDQECCGGKIEKVSSFECSHHQTTTVRQCLECPDFICRDVDL